MRRYTSVRLPVRRLQRRQENPARKRRSSCGRISTLTRNVLIDVGIPDLGKRFPRSVVDRVFLTHYHIDHVWGLFPVRWGLGPPLPVHGPADPEGCADLFKHPGILDFSDPLHPFVQREFGELSVTPLPLAHSKLTFGYAMADEDGESRMAWLCDTSGLPEQTAAYLQQWRPRVMVLDCTFPPRETPHAGHNDLNQAISLHRQIAPQRTYLIHISHQFAVWLTENDTALPENMFVAMDGMVVEV